MKTFIGRGFLPFEYLYWHYVLVWKDIFQIFANFVWFIYYFFSIPILFRTFFSYWKRMHEPKPAGLNPKVYIQNLIVNSLMRVVGVFFRAIVISLGILSLLASSVIMLAVIVVWILLPVIILVLIWSGISDLLTL